MRRSAQAGGILLADEIVSLGIWALAALTAVALFVFFAHWTTTIALVTARSDALDAAKARWMNEATSATALYVPPNDPVSGASNADGHVFEMLFRDAQRNDHFTTYRFDPAAKTVQRYTRDAFTGAPVASGAPLADIAYLHAVIRHAHDIARPWTTQPFADQEFAMGYDGVYAGNIGVRLMLVDVTGDYRVIRLASGTNPTRMNIITAVFSPSPQPMIAQPASLALDIGDTATVNVLESAGKYYTGAYLMTRPTPCDPFATVSDFQNLGPKAAWPFTVVAQAPALCAITVNDQVGNPPLAIPVTIRGPLAVDPQTLTFNGLHDTQPLGTHADGSTSVDANANFTISQANGTPPYIITPDASCANVLANMYPVMQSDANGMFGVQAKGTGRCVLTIAPSVGHAAAVAATIVVTSPIVVSPTSIPFPSASAPPVPLRISEEGYSGAFTIDESACLSPPGNGSAIAAFSASSLSDNPGTITVSPNGSVTGSATCVIRVSDTLFNLPGTPGEKTVLISLSNTEVCSKTWPPTDEGKTFVDGTMTYTSNGKPCSYNYELLSSVTAATATDTQAITYATEIQACRDLGLSFCTLRDGSGAVIGDVCIAVMRDCIDFLASAQGASADSGAYCDTATSDGQTGVTCTTASAGSAGNGSGGSSTTTVSYPTLVDIITYDYEQTWYRCYVASNTSLIPTGATPPPVVATYPPTNFPPSVRLQDKSSGILITPKRADGSCESWAAP